MLFTLLAILLVAPLIALYYYREYHKLAYVSHRHLDWCIDEQKHHLQLEGIVQQLQEEKVDRLDYIDSLETQLAREQRAHRAYIQVTEERHAEDQRIIQEAYAVILRAQTIVDSTRERFVATPPADENHDN